MGPGGLAITQICRDSHELAARLHDCLPYGKFSNPRIRTAHRERAQRCIGGESALSGGGGERAGAKRNWSTFFLPSRFLLPSLPAPAGYRLFFLFPSVSLSPFSDERWSNSFPFKVMDTEILPELSAWVQRTAKSLFRRSVVHLPALHAPSASPGLIGVVAPEERASGRARRRVRRSLYASRVYGRSHRVHVCSPALPSKRDTTLAVGNSVPSIASLAGSLRAAIASPRTRGRKSRRGAE